MAKLSCVTEYQRSARHHAVIDTQTSVSEPVAPIPTMANAKAARAPNTRPTDLVELTITAMYPVAFAILREAA